MLNKRNLFFLFCPIVFSSLFFSVQKASALGQITEPIVIKSALRGQSATAVLTILNSESKEIKVDLKAEGQIGAWATFYDINDKKMANPINQLSLPIKAYQDAMVKFEIPADAPNGVYTGVIGVATVPETTSPETESSSNISQRIDREVSITVSDKEVVALNVSVIPSTYDLSKNESLKIRIIYDNQGNVAIKPDAQLKISRDGQTIYNAIFPYPEDENAVKPLERKELSSLIEWQTIGQENGEYRAEIKILYQGDLIQEESFRFNVGTVINAGQFLAAVAKIGGGNMTLGWIFAGLLLVAGAAALIALYKNPKLIKVGISKFRSLF